MLSRVITLLLCLAGVLPSTAEGQCSGLRQVSSLAGSAAIGGTVVAPPVIFMPGLYTGWTIKGDTWKLGYWQAAYSPAALLVWPEAPVASGRLIDSDFSNCTPSLYGYYYGIFYHEWLHSLCPPHDGPEGPNPPFEPGAGPITCNNLNYVISTASEMCRFMGQLSSCISGQTEDCPPLRDPSGNPIPNLDTCEAVKAMCEEMKESYEQMQDSWNNEASAAAALDCSCGGGNPSSPWSPSSHAACPNSFSPAGPEGSPPAGPGFPPNGCDGQPPYPGNKIIPDCPSCPDCP